MLMASWARVDRSRLILSGSAFPAGETHVDFTPPFRIGQKLTAMSRAMTHLSFPTGCSEKKPVYSMVVLCENAAARGRAGGFCEDLIREIGDDLLWAQEAWDFTLLESPHTRRQATQAAANADVVILALDGHEKLTDDFKAWIEEWGGHLFDRSPVLFTLFNETDDQCLALVSNRAFLETIVDMCGLTFLYTMGETIVEHQAA